ncbi:MAG: acetyltransferase [Gammaproteobacteria bacterium RIFOXYA12_FULL_61_12]|nr:MAG: acetyltransferase [Gammaproteobacteria bacterium RIFOXYA12_FULL_61_12]OGT88406.1 MAG: acetyltransferase [Gammaproteobacteria bacterium RIFOXYD12_FULL_61_37]
MSSRDAYDVFNGDADGICALLQLRLAEPRDATLITGVKRDIGLLARVPVAAPAEIRVLDLSLDKNRQALLRQLELGSRILYLDHHDPGTEGVPEHPGLTAHIDTDPNLCTSLIADRLLRGRFRLWAITGAFGDNLIETAEALCRQAGLDEGQMERLNRLGVCLNYNGYGTGLDDLHFHPADLYRALSPFQDPFDFLHEGRETWQRLLAGYEADLAEGLRIAPEYSDPAIAVLLLPDEAWARRVNGPLGNELCNRHPARAHAIVTRKGPGTYQVSIRAPLNNRNGANELAAQFPTGGGRKGAAGINELPEADLPRFIEAMRRHYQKSTGR